MSALLTAAELLIAGGTLAAAFFAKQSADSSAKAMQAQLYSELIRSYDEDVMSDALRELSAWQVGQGENFTTVVSSWAKEIASAQATPAGKERDRKRRFVSHFYNKAALLIEEGMIEKGLREEIVALYGKEVMRDVVLPMDKTLHMAQKSPSGIAKEREDRFLRVFFPDKGNR